MVKAVKQILSNSANQLSSKRVVTMIFVVVLVVSFFVSQFTTHQVDSHLFDDIMYIVLAGLGLTGAEKITDIFNK